MPPPPQPFATTLESPPIPLQLGVNVLHPSPALEPHPAALLRTPLLLFLQPLRNPRQLALARLLDPLLLLPLQPRVVLRLRLARRLPVRPARRRRRTRLLLLVFLVLVLLLVFLLGRLLPFTLPIRRGRPRSRPRPPTIGRP
ncbi:hypothetical protein BD309DRAFT_277669 [Dichomitus squalens]|nr:hypothetical protein BD309DRAFT_277669 [Dichomitus squalens]